MRTLARYRGALLFWLVTLRGKALNSMKLTALLGRVLGMGVDPRQPRDGSRGRREGSRKNLN